ncbi:Plasmodium vivax Vir protein, putative [Plasmodium vivax]|uniref:Vir protein, putative n=1 Tax=Plasmodium vivax TaxID=5855 RepID=A0A1G4EAF9_PLAVI|nr:Plasmodium vivax Vir protein, putative [Plasmodium vivax]
MSSEPQDPGYIGYHDYVKARHEFYRTLNNEPDDEYFDKIIKEITNEHYERYLKNKTLILLRNVLYNDNAYYYSMKPNYCRYINFWLNENIQNTDNDVDASYINIFQNFSEKLSLRRLRNRSISCKEYIFSLSPETINKMKFLYNLYDAYNEIKSQHIHDKPKTCNNIFSLAKQYRDIIYDYYNKDKYLYDKLEYIIDSIDKITGIANPPCTQKIYFTKPPELVNLLEEQAQKKAEEQAAKLAKEAAARQIQEAAARRVQEAADRRVHEAEARRVQEPSARHIQEPAAQKLQEEQYHQQHSLLQPKVSLSRSPDKELQGMHHENGELHPTSYRAESQGSVTSRLQSPAQRLVSSEMSESSTGSLFLKKYTQQGPMTYTIEGTEQPSELVHDQEDKGTTKAGTFFSSSGFPGYITEVLGSVEPAPVLGVSGGMGALFLLFKYTPVGSFFGRRGRGHRIPRTFTGQYPVGFPGYEEYYDGNFGLGPINISYQAE